MLSRETKRLLVILLGLDLLFIAIHLAYSLPRCTFNSLLQIDVDGGYAEMFQYAKEAAVALLLLLAALRKRSRHLAAWSLLFLFSFLDDALQFHEAIGRLLVGGMGAAVSDARVFQSLSEVVVLGVFGAVLLGIVGLTYRRADAEVRRHGWHLLALFAGLAFFGVLGDLVQGATTYRMARHALALFEDGGEMLALTVIVVYAWMMLRGEHWPLAKQKTQ